jgi:O-methyltransferase
MQRILKAIFPTGVRRKLRYSSQVWRTRLPVLERLAGVLWDDRFHFERTSRNEFLRRAFQMQTFNGIAGDYTEFGSNGGGTIPVAWRECRRTGVRRHLWAFDSFAGLPPDSIGADQHPAWVEGAMATGLDEFHQILRAHRIPRSAYSVVPGFFADTIDANGNFSGALPFDISIAYIDCDLYVSTVPVLEFLKPRLKHGMLIALDDYFCYSATRMSGERRALLELMAATPDFEFIPYQPFGWHGMSFVVETATLAARGNDVS